MELARDFSIGSNTCAAGSDRSSRQETAHDPSPPLGCPTVTRLPLALAATAALAFVGAAQASVVTQKSIRGIALSDSLRKVHDKLGKPDATAYYKSEILGKVRSDRFGLTTVRYDGTGTSAKVVQVDTRSPKERTAKGIGLGSTRAEALAKVPGLSCEDSPLACSIGEFVAGAKVTTFYFNEKGVVREISIGRVID